MLNFRAAGAMVLAGIAVLALLAAQSEPARADKVVAKNGMTFEGTYAKVSDMAQNVIAPANGNGAVNARLIVLLDDNLRRTFLSTWQVQSFTPSNEPQVSFKLDFQRVAKAGQRIASVGQIIHIGPFDEFGRRVLKMNTDSGQRDIVQGITEITPTWTKVEGLLGNANFIWDMRIATSSIPRSVLSAIFKKCVNQNNAQQRLSVVKFYIQSDRFGDARAELEQAINDFPGLAPLKNELSANVQAQARRTIKEIELRQKAGQHGFAQRLLEKFPSEDVAGETLLRVKGMLDDYKAAKAKGDDALKKLDGLTAQLADDKQKATVTTIRDEIAKELNHTTLDRMADFLRLASNEAMPAEQRISLAISAWVLGSGNGDINLAVSLSLYEVRDLVKEYLSGAARVRRDEIIKLLAAQEGSTPKRIAMILAAMKPPLAPDIQQANAEIPGLYTLKVPGLAEDKDFVYHVQLPPEYDPYRRYPVIVTLCGGGTTALQQVDWWAGGWNAELKMRVGQATRRGYIVIAPEWKRQHQAAYEYSPREHAAVLYSLRDACRRFSINTDRTYLSGHSMGGDAAWDIALAHPDLFAGTLPVVATADKFITRYWENARHAPLYFVSGSLDGDKLGKNSRDWDRYLKGANFDTTIVEYLGRGHEHFIDEIQRMFDWMELHERNFAPREFKVQSMRVWDNFFWWAELDDFPANTMVNPVNWPPLGGTKPAESAGKIVPETLNVILTTAAGKATVYLAPEMFGDPAIVDLTKPITVKFKGKDTRVNWAPTAATLLEDVRTRGDRQHPYWMKVGL